MICAGLEPRMLSPEPVSLSFNFPFCTGNIPTVRLMFLFCLFSTHSWPRLYSADNNSHHSRTLSLNVNENTCKHALMLSPCRHTLLFPVDNPSYCHSLGWQPELEDKTLSLKTTHFNHKTWTNRAGRLFPVASSHSVTVMGVVQAFWPEKPSTVLPICKSCNKGSTSPHQRNFFLKRQRSTAGIRDQNIPQEGNLQRNPAPKGRISVCHGWTPS